MKALRIEKGLAVDRMTAVFPARQCKWHTLYYFVRRIDSNRSVERLPGSGRHRSVSDANIELVGDLIGSEKGQLWTSKSPREIARDRNFTIFICENCQEWFAAQSVSMPWSSVSDSRRQTETIECKATGNSRFETEKSPLANQKNSRKFPLLKMNSFPLEYM